MTFFLQFDFSQYVGPFTVLMLTLTQINFEAELPIRMIESVFE